MEVNKLFRNVDVEHIDADYYLTNNSKGIDLMFDSDSLLRNIQLNGGAKDEFSKFDEKLPCNLTFSDTKDSSHQKIGIDSFKSGGGKMLPTLGYCRKWRKYNFSNCYLHLEFNDDDSIAMVTIGHLDM